MPTPQEQGGAAASQKEPPDGALDTGHPSSKDGRAAPERPKSARELMLDTLDAKVVDQRVADNRKFLESGDPRAVALHAEMLARAGQTAEEEARAAAAAAPADAGGEDESDPPGTAATAAAGGTDPLVDYVVVRDGKPMFRTKVDGAERLIPLDAARTQLQKHIAADVRLQEAAAARKALDDRAAAIARAEADLRARESKFSQPSVQDAGDPDLETESRALVSSLMSDPEDVAAKKLAKVLAKTRQAPTAPQVDPNTIVNVAVEKAVQKVVERDQQRDLKSGWDQFQQEFSEIAADEALFSIADSKTNAIAQEHPEWAPSQVLLEAGRQTKSWLEGITGKRPSDAPASPTNDRQARKEQLRPMPAARAARREAAPAVPAVQSPYDALAEIRKGRGQPV